MWQTANKKRCYALFYADRLEEALESYRWMMDMSDENTKASCLDWCTAFKQECRLVYAANGEPDLAASGDIALAAGNFNRSIELYSAAIDLDCATHTIFAKRCEAKLGEMLWEEALLDAQKV
ncbi:hypothetical protein AZE42_04332 [Rhizopogon vesiculosus]|uniref:Uncharacterized protein n=1 Tax=Rhizopogon vesiculosus TaxID=180088 RepID=A0A1J8QG65_9AGAM|nr:hypothetical protein AZE42_04332 [Rhizopogon vesiculosus]